MTTLTALFAAIVAPEHITEAASIITIAPASTEEVSAVLRLCSEHKLTVTPCGGATKQDWGNPVTPEIILSTRNLAGIREHIWQDLTATVGAGTSWAEMRRHLAAHNQRVALDPLFRTPATVGGIIAVNDSGSLRHRYGSLRDLVIGMTVVLADGTIARSGGKVVKNVAGYDLPKLFTGSFGTLGIITEVTFRLHPVQPHAETWTLRSPDIAPLAALQQQLLDAAMSIESLQLRTETTGFALDVRFASLPEVLRDHELRLRELASPLTPTASGKEVWQQRENLFAIPHATILKITALPTQTAALLHGFNALASTGILAHAVADATGIVTVALNGEPLSLFALIADLRSRLQKDGGMAVVLRANSDLPADLDRWGGSPTAIAVMRAVKQEFDPQRLLNPGKFVGGI